MRRGLLRLFDVFQSPRLGVDITSRAVRTVLVRSERIVHTSELLLDGTSPLKDVLAQAVVSMRQKSRRKPRVFASIGAASFQVRRLTKLPSVSDSRQLRQIVRSNPARFFLKNGIPLLTTDLMVQDSGVVWGAALNEPPVQMLAEVCSEHGLRLESAVPAIIGLMRSLKGESLLSEDGDSTAIAHLDGAGQLERVSHIRDFAQEAHPRAARVCGPLAVLGPEGLTYAAAYGATKVDRSEPLAIHATDLALPTSERRERWNASIAACAFLMAVTMAWLAPPVVAAHRAAQSTARLAVIAPEARIARWTDRELAKVTQSLSEIGEFKTRHESVIGFLSELSTALPDSAWLVSLRSDDEGGTIVALSPHAATALSRLSEIHSIVSPSIAGSVSAEQVGAERVERVTIRFQWRGPQNAGARAPATTNAQPMRP